MRAPEVYKAKNQPQNLEMTGLWQARNLPHSLSQLSGRADYLIGECCIDEARNRWLTRLEGVVT